jgi:hemolysin-activating ACP:hemolysin acyltransferase
VCSFIAAFVVASSYSFRRYATQNIMRVVFPALKDRAKFTQSLRDEDASHNF